MSVGVTKPSILVVGSINMDLVLEADRVPLPGESYFGKNYHTIPGGKGANQATAAARFGAAVTFAGRVGDDPNGTRLKESLTESGIDTGSITVDADNPSGLAVIIVEPDGANRILVYPGANMQITPSSIAPLIESNSYDAILINLEIPDEVVMALCRESASRSIPVIVDAGPARQFPLETFRDVEILSPNETETEALTGMACDSEVKIEEAARILREKSGARWIVIKLGNRGSLAYNGDRFVRQKALPIKSIDSTAAGDAFTAGLAIRYLETHDIEVSLRSASAAGAIAVSRLGAQPSLPTRAECDEFLVRLGRRNLT